MEPVHRNIDGPHQLSRVRPRAVFWVLIELRLNRELAARQHHCAPAVRWFERRVAPHALLSDATRGHVQRLAKFAPFDLPEFVQREACVASPGKRRFKAVRCCAPGPNIAAVGARAPYARGHAQASCLAHARLAEEMKAAALEATDVEEGPCERGRDGEAQKPVICRKGSDACCPILKRSALAIRTYGLFGEDHPFHACGVNNPARQRECPSAVNLMPTCAVNDRHALFYIDGSEVFDEQAARGRSAFDVHAPIAERTDQGARVTMQRGEGDYPLDFESIGVLEPNQLAPVAGLPARVRQVTGPTKNFEWLSDPFPIAAFVFAP
jgi:hypothetical protein